MSVENSRRLLAGFFTFTGVMHFVIPKRYESIMPPYLPRHREAVQVSGVAEVAGGVGLLLPATRQASRWGLLTLLVAVFPANLHMAMHPDQVKGAKDIPRWLLWARLPLQLPLMVLVWRAGRD